MERREIEPAVFWNRSHGLTVTQEPALLSKLNHQATASTAQRSTRNCRSQRIAIYPLHWATISAASPTQSTASIRRGRHPPTGVTETQAAWHEMRPITALPVRIMEGEILSVAGRCHCRIAHPTFFPRPASSRRLTSTHHSDNLTGDADIRRSESNPSPSSSISPQQFVANVPKITAPIHGGPRSPAPTIVAARNTESRILLHVRTFTTAYHCPKQHMPRVISADSTH